MTIFYHDLVHNVIIDDFYQVIHDSLPSSQHAGTGPECIAEREVVTVAITGPEVAEVFI